MQEHKQKAVAGFTSLYSVNRLVYYEVTDDRVALTRERQIKAGSRAKKLALIADMNPEWIDLYDGLSDG